jgi:hypothetical protein
MPLSAGQKRDLLASKVADLPWIVGDPGQFRTKFERESFLFYHRLADHPLFGLERLIEVARTLRARPGDLVYDAGDIRIDQRWDDVPQSALSAHELLARIETAKAWVLLKYADRLPGYAELLDACAAEVERLSEREFARIFSARKAIIFVNSPGRISSYHIDHQSTFLLQIRGTKTISIFERSDREVLPERELERFWTTDENAAIYKPEFQARARVFELTPGTGVHIPVNAPHWVRNGPDVSVSLNFNFDVHAALLGDRYRANYWARKLGLNPQSPRHDVLEVSLLGGAYGAMRALRHWLNGAP